jgi:FKBP-type peptidyl-prolyl cis-trans isomerase
LEGNPPLMEQKDIQATLVSFQKELIAKRQENLQKISVKNKAEETKFLADNKSKPGVVTLADGLQYKIIKEGKGDSPKVTDTVIVNYEGTLPNGQVFDSSYAKGKPVTFPVDRVIPGWIEVLKLMKPGSQWMIYVPAELAYGDRGMGPIEANQMLIFKIELIAIQPPVAATPSSTAASGSNKKA